jgi:hypothetical protein
MNPKKIAAMLNDPGFMYWYDHNPKASRIKIRWCNRDQRRRNQLKLRLSNCWLGTKETP